MEICSPAFENMTLLATTFGLIPFPLALLLLYCVFIAISSLCGGALPTLVRLTHTQMQFLVSLIGGLMLGVGFFHQLPHAVAIMPVDGIFGKPALDSCMLCLMLGLLGTFFLLRIFHFHSHEPLDTAKDHSHDCGHDHDGDHRHDHDHDHASAVKSSIKTSWLGIFIGLSLHTILDGVALAAHVEADALHNHESGAFTLLGSLLGLGTFLGVLLHKPLDSLSITSLMASGGWSRQSMIIVNFCYAAMCPLGAALFYFGTRGQGDFRDSIVAAALAMSAGVFICISLSDLLPEVQFHSHDRLWLSAALLIGVGTAWAIGLVEPAHTHDHSNIPALPQNPDHRHPD